MLKNRRLERALSATAVLGCLLAVSPLSLGQATTPEDKGAPSEDKGMSGMSGMQGMQGMPGMGGMQGMQGMPGMGGMQGMPGMGGMQGMPGMGGMQGMPGMQGMQGMGVSVAPSRPVNSLDEARMLATDWLALTGQEDMTVGAIREADLVYVVNIVDKDSPHELRNQMIIRGADGFYIMVR
jgi:hypothetical protein